MHTGKVPCDVMMEVEMRGMHVVTKKPQRQPVSHQKPGGPDSLSQPQKEPSCNALISDF